MATYRFHTVDAIKYLNVEERPLYGSSRLGSYVRREHLHDILATTQPGPDVVQPMDLNYELTDHLGNVCAVVSGRLLDGNGGGSAKQPELTSASGYEPFGSLLPGRNYNSGSSRYLFQGQEHDDEINGAVGTSYAYTFRMHDPRIGRFLSIDPLAAKYPFYSPYAFSGNRVIDAIELEGLEPLALTPENKPITPKQNKALGSAISHGTASLIDGPTYVLSTTWQGLKGGGAAAWSGLTGGSESEQIAAADKVIGSSWGFSWENGFQPEKAPKNASDLPLNGNGGRVMSGTATIATAPLMFGGGAAATEARSTSTALSTSRSTTAGEEFFHYGFSQNAESFTGGLRPGGYATSSSTLSGEAAQTGLALPARGAPDAFYTVRPPAGTPIESLGNAWPKYGQPGGLPEYRFPLGTPRGSVTGPTSIPPK